MELSTPHSAVKETLTHHQDIFGVRNMCLKQNTVKRAICPIAKEFKILIFFYLFNKINVLVLSIVFYSFLLFSFTSANYSAIYMRVKNIRIYKDTIKIWLFNCCT